MSLKNDFLTGPNGLEQNVSDAFQAGMAFVGTGVAEIQSLSLGDRNGLNLAAGNLSIGTYFDIDGPSGGYRLWIYVSGEVAPSSAGRTLIQITLLSTDTTAQAATKIATALSGISTDDFTTLTVGGAIEITNNAPKTVNPISLGATGWGTAVAAVSQLGSDPVGNYLTISNALKAYALSGRTEFRINLPTTYSSTILRANHGNNLILKAYFAGITQAFANENIYSYEIHLRLNVSDKANTSVDMVFNFSYNQKTHHEVSYEIPPFTQTYD